MKKQEKEKVISQEQLDAMKELLSQYDGYVKQGEDLVAKRTKPISKARRRGKWLMLLVTIVLALIVVWTKLWPTVPLRNMFAAGGLKGYYAVLLPIALVILFPVSWATEKIVMSIERKSGTKEQ